METRYNLYTNLVILFIVYSLTKFMKILSLSSILVFLTIVSAISVSPDTFADQSKVMVGTIDITTASPIEGSDDASVTIVEFGDFQCPKCDQWFKNEKPTITTKYIDTGKANLYFIDFPFLGKDSDNAANASYCDEEQGKYWEYHNILYTNQKGIQEGWASMDNLKKFAIDVGLDANSFNECLDSGSIQISKK